MYQYIFNIAQLNIVIHTPVSINFQSCMEPFRMESEKVEPIHVVYQIMNLWEDYENDSECNKKDFAVKKINDKFVRIYPAKVANSMKKIMIYSEEKNKMIIQYPMQKDVFLFEHFNIWNYMAFENPLLYYQAFLLHSSFISWQNNGILFTAPSGTGKSTQADLWKKYEDADIYNGDRTIIRKIDGKYYGFGSPYAGSSGIYRNESAPIKAIIVIEQGPDNVIRRLRGREAFLPLFRETLMNTWNKEYMEKMTDLLMDAACQIPVYHLSCRPDQDAVNTVKNEILKEL